MIHTTTPWARDAVTPDLRATLEAMFPDGLRVAAVGRWWVLTTLPAPAGATEPPDEPQTRPGGRRIKISRNVSLLDACEWLHRQVAA